jgi:hypothetical protein
MKNKINYTHVNALLFDIIINSMSNILKYYKFIINK